MQNLSEQNKMKIAESSLDWTPKYIDIVSVAFVTALLVSNIAAQKLFALGPAIFTAGILVFPISYIFGDVLTEVYGFKRSRRIIYSGFAANAFMSTILWIAVILPPAPGWPFQNEFATINLMVPRIVIASLVGYLIGELTNSVIMSKLKIATEGKYLWLRTISSTIAGQCVDTFIFAYIAFGGVLDNNLIITSSLWGWGFKVVYEAVATPITYLIVGKLKQYEGVEHYDKKDSINLF